MGVKKGSTLKKKSCTKTNPKPPCVEGKMEKKVNFSDGSSGNCCYKINNYKRNNSTYKSQKKCTSRTPSPPCSEGKQEKDKIFDDGSKIKCCYKIPNFKRSQKTLKNRMYPKLKPLTIKTNGIATNFRGKKTKLMKDCPPKTPSPPCLSGKELKTRKDGSECCYSIKNYKRSLNAKKNRKTFKVNKKGIASNFKGKHIRFD